jgi:hypothetical protein
MISIGSLCILTTTTGVREKSDKIEAAEHDQMSAFAGSAQMERSDT